MPYYEHVVITRPEISPQQVDAMSLYQLACAVEGWNACHGAGEQMLAPLTAEEYDRDIAEAAARRARMH